MGPGQGMPLAPGGFAGVNMGAMPLVGAGAGAGVGDVPLSGGSGESLLNLIVSGLPPKWTFIDIGNYFEQFGDVSNCTIGNDGKACVTFSRASNIIEAYQKLPSMPPVVVDGNTFCLSALLDDPDAKQPAPSNSSIPAPMGGVVGAPLLSPAGNLSLPPSSVPTLAKRPLGASNLPDTKRQRTDSAMPLPGNPLAKLGLPPAQKPPADPRRDDVSSLMDTFHGKTPPTRPSNPDSNSLLQAIRNKKLPGATRPPGVPQPQPQPQVQQQPQFQPQAMPLPLSLPLSLPTPQAQAQPQMQVPPAQPVPQDLPVSLPQSDVLPHSEPSPASRTRMTAAMSNVLSALNHAKAREPAQATLPLPAPTPQPAQPSPSPSFSGVSKPNLLDALSKASNSKLGIADALLQGSSPEGLAQVLQRQPSSTETMLPGSSKTLQELLGTQGPAQPQAKAAPRPDLQGELQRLLRTRPEAPKPDARSTPEAASHEKLQHILGVLAKEDRKEEQKPDPKEDSIGQLLQLLARPEIVAQLHELRDKDGKPKVHEKASAPAPVQTAPAPAPAPAPASAPAPAPVTPVEAPLAVKAAVSTDPASRPEGRGAVYLVMKSPCHEYLQLSVEHELWFTSEAMGEKLNKYLKNANTVILVFSVTGSGIFTGYAEMHGPVKHRREHATVRESFQELPSSWQHIFRVNWLRVGSVEFVDTLQLRSDGRPVQYARDCETISSEAGAGLCNMVDEASKKGTKQEPQRATPVQQPAAAPRQPAAPSLAGADLSAVLELLSRGK